MSKLSTTPPSVPAHHLFRHEAMKTTFHLRMIGEDEPRLRGLASECFHLIDELERKLSRYFEGGDVFRINNMKAGETLHISEECYECLLVAMEAYVHTGGLFDPTLGAKIEHRKTGQDGELPETSGQLTIHPDSPSVTCSAPGRIIDLGGIGKGFTLDQIGKNLTEWGVKSALLSAGSSTHLAIGQSAWPIEITGEQHLQSIVLQNESLSASGTTIQGCHIVHPQESSVDLNTQPSRIWALSPSAALSDAWSTTLMLLTPEEIKSAPHKDAMLSAALIEDANGFNRLNPVTPPRPPSS